MGCLKSDDKFVNIIVQRISESFFNVYFNAITLHYYKLYDIVQARWICQAIFNLGELMNAVNEIPDYDLH